jgi:adenosylhomocysteine nucleosidase
MTLQMEVNRVAIIAAMPGELKPLVRGWESTKVDNTVIYRTRLENTEVVAVCCGIGREPVARACMVAMEGGKLSAIVSIGWTGALSCGMKPGLAHIVNEVIDASTGERYRTATEDLGPAEIRLVTTKRIAGKVEKRQLAANYEAALVDMEAATVARLARVHDIPFYCLKAVSDEANESLPDMNPFLTRAGRMKTGSFVASVVLRPRYWPSLIRMGKNSGIGAVALAAGVNQLIREFNYANNH